MTINISASMLYDFAHCPHRVTMDLFGDQTERDEPNAFVQLLWEHGALHEKDVVGDLGEPFLDLSRYSGEEKERLTHEAIRAGESLIYSGRLKVDDLIGEPDLLRKENDGYVAGDIKSGSGLEGPEDHSKPKVHYAVQLGLYSDIMKRLQIGTGQRGFIWDINGDEVVYDFEALQGKRDPYTLGQKYQECLSATRDVVNRKSSTSAAYSSACKLCPWYRACLSSLEEANDLTLIPELGRSRRDTMVSQIQTVQELANSDPAVFIQGKKTVFPGIGPPTLEKFYRRAKLRTENGRPYLLEPVQFPQTELELFFDIETDPLRDICYLHGFVERRNEDNHSERFVYFLANEPTEAEEKRAFEEAWRYMQDSQHCTIYYYSKYERTIYRKLREKYPDVCSEAELEALFEPERAVDLYFDVVLKFTEWPTKDFSIKSLADYLGFRWRDTHPSGAASIEWFHKWTETKDPLFLQRIIDYNEDDCRATRVLKDAIKELTIAH